MRHHGTRRVRRRTTSLNLRDCTATGRVLSFLIKIHSPSHKRVAECSCTVVHTHMSQNSKRSHALRRALSGGEHLPGRSADARGPQICDTRIHVLSTRKQNKLFVCGTLLRGRWRVERPAPRVPAPVVSLPHGGKKSYKITIFSRFSFDPRERSMIAL